MKDRITVQEAAYRLGVKDDAIRKRIQRGTLEHEKDSDGRVYVYLDATHDASHSSYRDETRYPSKDSYEDGAWDTTQDAAHDTTKDSSYAALLESMVAQIGRLETEVDDWKQVVATRDEEIRRRDAILLTIAQRLPELDRPAEESAEPSPELRDSLDMLSESATKGTAPPEQQKPTPRRSWLYKFFFGPS
jgi:excisionase family DNA binding protein